MKKKRDKEKQRDFAKGDLVDFKIYTLEETLHNWHNPFTVVDAGYVMMPGATKGYMVYTIASKDGVKRFDVTQDEITISLEQMRDDKLKELGI